MQIIVKTSISISEGAVGSYPTKFMAELIPEILFIENFPSSVVINSVHCSLGGEDNNNIS